MYAVLGAKWCDACNKLKDRIGHRDDIKFLDIDQADAFNLFCDLKLKNKVKKIPVILKYENEIVMVISEEDL
jgi:hypothetical protein